MTSARRGTAARRGMAGIRSCAVLVALLAGFAFSPGCARPLLERAIAARGGPLTSLSREVEADVVARFPGTWRWHIAYRVPDRLRWTLETHGEEQSYAFDGEKLRLYLGTALVVADPAATESFRSQVRWIALTALDALANRDTVEVRELPAAELPPRAASGLGVTYRDDGASYVLYFDARDLLIEAAGPISVPTVGAGELHGSFSDFRDVSGYLLAHRGRYTLDSQPLFEERVTRWLPNDPRLTRESFSGPVRRLR